MYHLFSPFVLFCRLAFYEFINNEDVRKLFVYNKERQIIASLIPPFDLKYKSIFFLKCNAGTKLTKENIGKYSRVICLCRKENFKGFFLFGGRGRGWGSC